MKMLVLSVVLPSLVSSVVLPSLVLNVVLSSLVLSVVLSSLILNVVLISLVLSVVLSHPFGLPVNLSQSIVILLIPPQALKCSWSSSGVEP